MVQDKDNLNEENASEENISDEKVTEVKNSAEGDKIVESLIEDEMKRSYLDYAMSVIIARALPDVRDGMKPVHRRILYAMNDMGMLHNKPYKKSARIVGEVLGKYHPHGDSSVYEAMVRMAQDFSLRYPLVQGQGNFGSIDGDSAAAMRYTEARLNRLAEEMLQDIDKETVDFTDNFDGSLKEPLVLPAKFPGLLINGTSGIAVGMATNIPPHNIGEICDGVKAVIDDPEIEVTELMHIVKGPDFPTGGTITTDRGIERAYLTGRGKIKVRSKYRIENYKGRERIIVDEIPYMVNKAMLIEQIAELVRDKKIVGISDLRDESDREGLRIVIELKKDAQSDIVINQLMKFSRLKVTFGINMLALVDNEPKTLGLRDMLSYFIEHRVVVIRRRTQFELTKAEKRAHIIEGLIIALDNIDEVIQKIKASKDTPAASRMLIEDYSLSEEQAKAILEMRLQKLSSLEQEKLRTEQSELLVLIGKLKEILASHQMVLDIIKQEMEELKSKYSDKRRSDIVFEADEDEDIEDLVEEEDVVVTISHQGYIKRLAVDTYKQQRRGGKGVIGATTKEEDFIEHLFIANTHDYILFFTDKGQVHWLKVYNIPEASRQSKGKALVNLLEIENDEKITAFIPVKEFAKDKFLFMATDRGTVKKTQLESFANPRKGGIRAITLDDNERLINAMITSGNQQIILATESGIAAKFNETDVREMGRSAHGVRGISLRGDDKVIGAVIANDEKTLLSITENGYGKRTPISEYRLIGRGGKGVINIQCSERNGNVVAVKQIEEIDDILMISKNGIVIRTNVRDISVIGRNTQGVRLMNLKSDDKIVSAAKIIPQEDEI